nr:hypothetical protein Itr_chr13CG21010 [Ipomoea trifida]
MATSMLDLLSGFVKNLFIPLKRSAVSWSLRVALMTPFCLSILTSSAVSTIPFIRLTYLANSKVDLSMEASYATRFLRITSEHEFRVMTGRAAFLYLLYWNLKTGFWTFILDNQMLKQLQDFLKKNDGNLILEEDYVPGENIVASRIIGRRKSVQDVDQEQAIDGDNPSQSAFLEVHEPAVTRANHGVHLLQLINNNVLKVEDL